MKTPNSIQRKGIKSVRTNLPTGYSLSPPGNAFFDFLGPEIQQAAKHITDRKSDGKEAAANVSAK